jgi:hypothetical protein
MKRPASSSRVPTGCRTAQEKRFGAERNPLSIDGAAGCCPRYGREGQVGIYGSQRLPVTRSWKARKDGCWHKPAVWCLGAEVGSICQKRQFTHSPHDTGSGMRGSSSEVTHAAFHRFRTRRRTRLTISTSANGKARRLPEGAFIHLGSMLPGFSDV